MPIRTDLARIVLGVACLALPVVARGQSQPQQQLPPGATAFLNMSYEQLRPLIAQLPCPLPGLPPEIARYVDCSVLRPISDTTPYQPIPTPGGLSSGVDHRTQGLVGAIRDQGETGSCSANAIASLIDTYVLKRGLGPQRASALHVFAIYEHTAVQGATDDNIGNLKKVAGVTSETVWPYDPVKACRVALGSAVSGCDTAYHVQAGSGYTDPVIMAERQRADATPLYRIAGLETIADTAGRDAEIMKLLGTGEAVYIAVDMAINWSIAGPGGFHGEVLPPPQGYYGSHAVLAQGFRTVSTGTQFLIQNSWGTSWGQSGFVWVPEDIFKSRLRGAYRLHVEQVTNSRTPGPAPTPTPAPVATATSPTPSCPPGTTPILGLCMPVWVAR
ncbi:MAG: C1 family peptidase [Polyangiaceae bacterium]